MEDKIEEQRHDTRKETMEETWKKVEDMEPNKTYRVSYSISTTTVEKSKDDAKPEEDEERLFGNHVLLPNSEKVNRLICACKSSRTGPWFFAKERYPDPADP
jgi:hypothetical protein